MYGTTIQYSKIYDYLTGSLYPYFWSAGGEVWDPTTGKVSGVLNTDKNAEMLALAKSMMSYCPPGAIDVDIGGIVENYTTGKAVTAWQWAAMGSTMADACKGKTELGAADVDRMLQNAVEGVMDIGSAKRGDKTLLDTLIPAQEAFAAALAQGGDLVSCLAAMTAAAEAGWQATETMVAKVGRASRLGERSRGVLDAGATSCCLLLQSLGNTLAGMAREAGAQ